MRFMPNTEPLTFYIDRTPPTAWVPEVGHRVPICTEDGTVAGWWRVTHKRYVESDTGSSWECEGIYEPPEVIEIPTA